MQVAPDPALLRDGSVSVTVGVIAAAALLLLALVKSTIKIAKEWPYHAEGPGCFWHGRLR